MGQVKVNPPSGGPVVSKDGGFRAGLTVGVILLCLMLLVLISYAVAQLYRATPSYTRSSADLLACVRHQSRGDAEQRLAAFRKVRDVIEKRVRSLASRLG